MRFYFVEQGNASPGNRRAARSHVMKGKNAGRVLPPRSQKSSKPSAAKKPEEDRQPPPDGTLMAMRRLAGSDLSIISPGTEMSPHTRLLFNQCMCSRSYSPSDRGWLTILGPDFHIVADAIYPPELCQSTDPMKSMWFEFLLNEKSCKFRTTES